MDAEQAWKLARGVTEVRVAKGKQVLRFKPSPDTQAEVLKEIMGRSGNLRAPTLRARGMLWVGYNASLYAELVDEMG